MANKNSFLEKDLEEILFSAPQSEIRKRGLRCYRYDSISQQINLGAYGITDIVTIKNEGYRRIPGMRSIIVTIYELKHRNINTEVLIQAARYYKGISDFCNENFNLKNTEIEYQICLIGSTIDKSSGFVYLSDLFDNLSVYTFDYKIDGIQFKEESGYSLINPQFPKKLKTDIIFHIKRSISEEKHLPDPLTIDDLPF